MAAAAAAAADGMALPTVFEQAAAGAGVGVAGSGASQQLCIVRDGEAARMGGCEEQTRLALQVRDGQLHPAHRHVFPKCCCGGRTRCRGISTIKLSCGRGGC